MGIVSSENFAYLLDPGLRKVFVDEFGAPGDMISQLYSIEKSGKAVEYETIDPLGPDEVTGAFEHAGVVLPAS